MAEIIQEEKGKKGGKRRPKKQSTRIDMTPMVDLMCLLITFFMLTTAFSKPKVMIITMPEKDTKQNEPQTKIPKERTLNVLMTGNDKVYYYTGLAEAKQPLPYLAKSDFSKDGIRKVLLAKNKDLFTKIANYRDSVTSGKLKIFVYIDDSLKPVFAREGHRVFISADQGASWTTIPNPNSNPEDNLIGRIILQNAQNPELAVLINNKNKRIKKRDALSSEENFIVDGAIKSMKRDDKKGPIILIKADEKAKYKDVVNIIDEMAICNIASYAIVDISPIELEMLANAPK